MPALAFAQDDAPAIPLVAVTKTGLDAWLATQDSAVRTWAEATGFDAGAGRVMAVPDASGRIVRAVAGLGTPKDAARERFVFGKVRSVLPAGTYRLETDLAGAELEEAALAWLLAGYRFGRYKSAPPPKAELIAPAGVDRNRVEAIAAGEALTRDLINTPASDMGPEELAAAASDLAREHGAAVAITAGEDLLAANMPMIHAVGRASSRAPRLIDLRWGETGPRLTLVGKGVCFDTGGLNLKPSGSMGLMKKDMGGAATVLGLARMIMALKLPLRLRVLIPAVENAVSGAAFRPQDVLTSRKGLTVEINNTDAEGRLVLADALTLASEDGADLLVSMATLTGAARVAVGPDLAPFFTDDDRLASALSESAARVRDPVWRLPFWEPYEALIEPAIADLDNAPSGGMAGAITAALFLRRFADVRPYVHFDIYGWQPTAAAGRAKGGVGQGARALLDALPRVLDL
jgi:leucyl aminopeptidase